MISGWMNSMKTYSVGLLIGALLFTASHGFAQKDPNGNEEKTTLQYGKDHNIKVIMKGRAGNLELYTSAKEEGQILTNYQKGEGYVSYDRDNQILKWETKIGYTLNRMSKHIQRIAPYMWAYIPKNAELDFDLDITNLGYGSFMFTEMDINHFKFDVNYGDVDFNFPTENHSIVRGSAKFHLMAGDLEIKNLANLRARKIKINSGAGETSIDIGPKLLVDTDMTIDHDIGSLELSIPKGTRVTITGTSRDLSQFGLQESGKKIHRIWTPSQYSENSPKLNIKLKGPMGDLDIIWK